jgi:hypothetical protein
VNNEELSYLPAGEYLKKQVGVKSLNDVDLPNIAIKATQLGVSAWALTGINEANLLQKILNLGQPLSELAEKIFQGIRTSANEIYVLDVVSDTPYENLCLYSKSLDTQVLLERDLLKPFLRGEDIKAYSISEPKRYVLIPYWVRNEKVDLIPAEIIERNYPLCWQYLLANREALELRENGRMRHDKWFAFVYPKNLTEFSQPKIITPDIAPGSSFSLDTSGNYYFVSGYGIVLKEDVSYDLRYLLGLINSAVLDFYFKKISTRLQQGFYRYFTQYIAQLPIRRIDFADFAEKAAHDAIAALVTEMLELQQSHAAAEREKLDARHALKRRIDEIDAEIDRRVYELYRLTEEEIKVVEGG